VVAVKPQSMTTISPVTKGLEVMSDRIV